MSLDFWFRLLTILIFVIMRLYWHLVKQKTLLNKRKSQNKLLNLEKIGMILGAYFIFINLLGFTILRFESIAIQLLGLILIILGCLEAIIGRHILGINWTESYDYQIKKKHQLITYGIYKYVRHPIYGGLIIAITGAFIVSKTYLFIPVFFFQIITMTYFARREENLLQDYFEEKFILYKRRTKMFIPFIF